MQLKPVEMPAGPFRSRAASMAAMAASMALSSVVALDRSVPEAFAFDYQLALSGNLSEAQRSRLERAAAQCPVSKTIAANPRLRALPTA